MLARINTLSIITVAILLLCSTPVFTDAAAMQGKIGVITPLTGDMAQNGLTAKVGMDIALQDFKLVYPDSSLELVIEDSESNPSRSLEIIQKFYTQGIRVVIVTGASQEVSAIKPFADANNMIVIASTSTAPSLAQADSIVRIKPNDLFHAQGMAEYLRFRGIETVVPICRNDVFGREFFAAFKTRFEEKGGAVAAGVTYDTATSDFSSGTEDLSKQVLAAQQVHSASTVAVLTVAFDEIYSILASASSRPALSTVNWYGVEDHSRNPRIDNDPVTRSFALSVQYTYSVFSPHATVHPFTSIIPSFENLVTRGLKINPGISETTLGVFFDSLWLAGLIVNYNITSVPMLLNGSLEYLGYSDYIDLDQRGERLNEFYSFFRYEEVGGVPKWALAGSYYPTKYLVRPPISTREFVPDEKDKLVRIGLLFSLTGNYATAGKNFARMVEIAEKDIDAFLQRKYTPNSKIEFVMANTASDPDVALTKIQEMKKQGIQMVIGPLTSAELEKVADFANQNEMLLISPSSTAASLAKDDNIFRLTLSDQKQVRALASLLIQEGYRNVEGFYRNDIYGSGFFSLFSKSFTEMGGRCGAGIPYDPKTKQFDGILKTLETQVSDSLKNYSAKETAVLMISFDEGVAALETLAGSTSILADLRWFGTDGIAANASVLASPAATEMAVRTRLTASVFGWGGTDFKVSYISYFRAKISQELGFSPSACDVSAYDAVWLFTELAENQDWQWNAPFAKIRSDFITLAYNTSGYRSMNSLDEYGDCFCGNIDFFHIVSNKEIKVWDPFATYSFFLMDLEGLEYFDKNGASAAMEWSLYQ